MMYGYGNGIGGWGYALTATGMILFWAAVIYGIVALVRYTRRDGPQRPGPAGPPVPGPERLLAERFGSGAVTSAQLRACRRLRYERPGPGNGRRLLLVIITVTLVSCAALALTLRASLPAGIPP